MRVRHSDLASSHDSRNSRAFAVVTALGVLVSPLIARADCDVAIRKGPMPSFVQQKQSAPGDPVTWSILVPLVTKEPKFLEITFPTEYTDKLKQALEKQPKSTRGDFLKAIMQANVRLALQSVKGFSEDALVVFSQYPCAPIEQISQPTDLPSTTKPVPEPVAPTEDGRAKPVTF